MALFGAGKLCEFLLLIAMNPPPADKLAGFLDNFGATLVGHLKTVPGCTDELLAAALALFVTSYAKAAGTKFTPIATITAGMLAAEFKKNRDITKN